MIWEYLTHGVWQLHSLAMLLPAVGLIIIPVLSAGLKIIFTDTHVVDFEYHLGPAKLQMEARKRAEEEYNSLYGGNEYGTGNQTDKRD